MQGTISNERGFKKYDQSYVKMPDEYKLNIAGELNEKLKRQIPKTLKKIILHGYLNLNELRGLYEKMWNCLNYV